MTTLPTSLGEVVFVSVVRDVLPWILRRQSCTLLLPKLIIPHSFISQGKSGQLVNSKNIINLFYIIFTTTLM